MGAPFRSACNRSTASQVSLAAPRIDAATSNPTAPMKASSEIPISGATTMVGLSRFAATVRR
ncbi:hypothetical protein ATO13_08651 [Stappia sp. 22II-S9-Z10]|nr:hypothetical protein ATO13_08651 [Stappia sp. 22II-S9-Z10]